MIKHLNSLTVSTDMSGMSFSFHCFSAYDCGVYTVCFAEVLCRKELLKDKQSVLSIITTDYIKKWRSETRDTIYKLAKK